MRETPLAGAPFGETSVTNAPVSNAPVITTYVAEVAAQLGGLSRAEREDTLGELESLLHADAERVGEDAAVRALGSAADYAARVREALRPEPEGPTPQGTILGMPYDFRGATVRRVSERLWDPANPRVFVPRLFGVGWTVNFGALAVKLRLVRPDDAPEAVFERIPPRAVIGALAVPALCALAQLALIAVSWHALPEQVPVHWGVSGAPDDWTSRASAFGFLGLFTVLPTIVAFARVMRPSVGQRGRVVAASAAGFLGVLGVGITAMTIADADGGASGNYMCLLLPAAFAIAFLLLLVPARLGVRAEWRDALVAPKRPDKKGKG